ncbi:2-phospho-L-lactate guanylyltransferase [Candidatus Bathyarchaeota archaeon]|nr:2-phospho-L-lactate guanylyltransferase [Candidatus Bathyarchaeota archaeon]MBS7627272.1 2-phospho-L-lactate guanylyltransferase [Candidatus Bathyarchaeota archaeon]
MSYAIVPLKPLSLAKGRLSPYLRSEDREGLVLSMLSDVLDAIGKSGVVDECLVISSDDRVLKAAYAKGFRGLMEKPSGNLNETLNYATDWCKSQGAKALLILPGDLPLIKVEDVKRLFSYMQGERGVVLAPCRRRKGTNALLRYPPDIMPTLFGKESFEAHLLKARSLGIHVSVATSEGLSFDIDTIDDLRDLLSSKNECKPLTRSFLEKIFGSTCHES